MNNYVLRKIDQKWLIEPVGKDGRIRSQVDQAYLKSLISYDPETGVIRSLVYGKRGRKPGDILGRKGMLGYIHICVGGKVMAAHRAIWCYMTGDMPESLVDHINGDPADNRWSNLRAATPSQNGQNKSVHGFVRKSYSGLMGAHKCGKKWTSKIMLNGTYYKLGKFSTAEEAHAAYIEAKAKLHQFNPTVRP